MKIGFCGSDNKYSFQALKKLIDAGHTVVYFLSVEIQNSVFLNFCNTNNIRVFNEQKDVIDNHLYVDLLISFSYKKLIKQELLNFSNLSINFHPAPLPDYRGRGTTMFAILKGEKSWGVTCHYISAGFDTGDIIEVLRFKIPEMIVLGQELSEYSWKKCVLLMNRIIKKIDSNLRLDSYNQSEGHYYSMDMLNKNKEVFITDTNDIINKKINAFWYLPYEGAYIRINGEKFYLINSTVFEKLKK